MPYRFATERSDASALASGHILRSAPGRTGFPARLATELFQRGVARLTDAGVRPPFIVYDPCCGTGQLLTTVGLLHRDVIRELIGSDIDDAAIALARRNLALVSPEGLERRIAELADLHDRFGKPGHAAALDDAERWLEPMTRSGSVGIVTDAFVADATRPGSLIGRIGDQTVDLVITDVPYGNWSAWSSERLASGDDAPNESPLDRLLETIRPVLAPGALVTLVSGKDQRVSHPAYRRVERWQLGRRRIEMLALATGDRTH
jgi:SAM-dependent methyltransferase